jgi:hypothetical protein
MIAVLLAGLLEAQVRHWIRETGCLVTGLKPEGRDNPYPTAKALLRAFGDYTLVVIQQAGGQKPCIIRSSVRCNSRSGTS